jgi:hypothetical protein
VFDSPASPPTFELQALGTIFACLIPGHVMNFSRVSGSGAGSNPFGRFEPGEGAA